MVSDTGDKELRNSGFAFAGIIAFSILVIVFLFFKDPPGLSQHRYFIPVLTGLIAFPAMLLTIVYCLRVAASLQLSTPEHAFGLPPGSIRAVLAIGFIVLVMIFGVFVLTEVDTPARRTLFAKHPVSITTASAGGYSAALQSKIDAELSRLSDEYGTGFIFDVVKQGDRVAVINVFAIRDNERTAQLAQQILTMLATALTAIVGFYFGSRAADDKSMGKGVERLATLKLDIQTKIMKGAGLHKAISGRVSAIRGELESATTDGVVSQRLAELDQIKALADGQAAILDEQMSALALDNRETEEIERQHGIAAEAYEKLRKIETALDEAAKEPSDWSKITAILEGTEQ